MEQAEIESDTDGEDDAAGSDRSHVCGRRHRRGRSAVPDGSNAIRVSFDQEEPEAVIFNSLALPSALVSWSWCQLTMLDELLVAILAAGRGGDGDGEVATAVRTVIGPVINALTFSEQRAHELKGDAATFRS